MGKGSICSAWRKLLLNTVQKEQRLWNVLSKWSTGKSRPGACVCAPRWRVAGRNCATAPISTIEREVTMVQSQFSPATGRRCGSSLKRRAGENLQEAFGSQQRDFESTIPLQAFLRGRINYWLKGNTRFVISFFSLSLALSLLLSLHLYWTEDVCLAV